MTTKKLIPKEITKVIFKAKKITLDNGKLTEVPFVCELEDIDRMIDVKGKIIIHSNTLIRGMNDSTCKYVINVYQMMQDEDGKLFEKLKAIRNMKFKRVETDYKRSENKTYVTYVFETN